MDTISAFYRAQAAREAGNKMLVFDWDKAARLIKERNPTHASAGLSDDWEWTGGTIYANGKPVKNSYTHLASIWATPELKLDDDKPIPCWKYADETEWNSGTKWPESALNILK